MNRNRMPLSDPSHDENTHDDEYITLNCILLKNSSHQIIFGAITLLSLNNKTLSQYQ